VHQVSDKTARQRDFSNRTAHSLRSSFLQ